MIGPDQAGPYSRSARPATPGGEFEPASGDLRARGYAGFLVSACSQVRSVIRRSRSKIETIPGCVARAVLNTTVQMDHVSDRPVLRFDEQEVLVVEHDVLIVPNRFGHLADVARYPRRTETAGHLHSWPRLKARRDRLHIGKPGDAPGDHLPLRGGEPDSVLAVRHGSVADVCNVPGDACNANASQLTNTGFDQWSGTFDDGQAGGTSWLRTTAPVKGGEDFTIRFAIWDTGDDYLNSTSVLDNFGWVANGGTVTIGTNPVPM